MSYCNKSSDIISSGNEPFPPSSSDDDGSRFLPPEQFPGPPKIGDHPQKDLDDMNNSLDDFDLGEAITQTRTHLNFLISKVPFRIMCMYIKRYLTSILIDPNRPEWPVPGMDKNQKQHFRHKVEQYTVKKGILYYLHKFSDKLSDMKEVILPPFSSTCTLVVTVTVNKFVFTFSHWSVI